MSKLIINSHIASILFLLACQPEAAAPTWYGDVAPLIVERCGSCHVTGGVAPVVLDQAPALADAMHAAIEERRMPPWPPDEGGVPLRGIRSAGPLAEALRAWQNGERMLGQRMPAPLRPVLPAPDATLLMPDPYQGDRTVSDDLRCFLLPAGPTGWITSYRWRLAATLLPVAHHVAAFVVAADVAEQLRTLDAQSPAPGWPCDSRMQFLASLDNSSAGPGSGYEYPPGFGVEMAAGQRLVLQVHYLPVAMISGDRSGVDLWLSGAAHPVKIASTSAPAETPCPTGIAADSADPCSREYAISHSSDPATIRANNDAAAALCGPGMHDEFVSSVPAHWYAQNECATPLLAGQIVDVHLHAHTYAVAGHVDVCSPDGQCTRLLDIPRQRPWWRWEATYALQRGFDVEAGSFLRVGCERDNGDGAQWGADGQPGIDGVGLPPRQPPHYLLSDSRRQDEMCSAWVSLIE